MVKRTTFSPAARAFERCASSSVASDFTVGGTSTSVTLPVRTSVTSFTVVICPPSSGSTAPGAPRVLGPLGEEGGGDHVAIGGGVVGGGDEPARRNSTRTIAAERTRLKAPSAMPAVP